MTKTKNVRRIMFPYGMARNKDGSCTLFNREYSPVGVVPSGYYEWDDEHHKIRIKDTDLNLLRNLDCSRSANEDRIYFYDDASSPEQSSEAMNNYLQKIAVLLRVEV